MFQFLLKKKKELQYLTFLLIGLSDDYYKSKSNILYQIYHSLRLNSCINITKICVIFKSA